MASIVMLLIGDIRYDGRVRKEIATLKAAGHSVQLIVSNFVDDSDIGSDLSIDIYYIPMKLRKYAISNFFEQLRFNFCCVKMVRRLSPDAVHCHDLSSLLGGVLAVRNTRQLLVFDAHELKPESLGGAKGYIWGFIERYCVQFCDVVIQAEANRARHFRVKYPEMADVRVLENFPRRVDIPISCSNLFRKMYGIEEEQKIVLYTGLLSRGRNIEQLICAMKQCSERVVLVLLGLAFNNYEAELAEVVAKEGLEGRVFLHPPVPHADMLDYIGSCDIGVAFYPNTNINNYYCASNKLYENIALDKVVICNSYPGLVERIEKYCLGICLPEIDVNSLAFAFEAAADIEIVTDSKKFFWEEQHQVLLSVYQQLENRV